MRIKWKAVVILAALFFLMDGLSVFAKTSVIKYQTDDYPPYKFTKNGYMSGFEIDFTYFIFDSEDYRIEHSVDAWDKIYDRLKKGEIDTCGMLAVNEDRKKEILFSRTVLQSYYAVYARRAPDKITLSDLKKYRVAIDENRYSESLLLDKTGVKNYSAYSSMEAAVDALNNGEVDALFGNQEVVNYLLNKKNLKEIIIPQVTYLFPADLAYGVRKGERQLLEYIDKRINDLQKSGVYEELYQKYFFSHSRYYREAQRTKTAVFILIAGLDLLIAFILLQIYIMYLKKRIIKEQVFSKNIINSANEELAAAEEELKQQFDRLQKKEEALRVSEERYRLAVDGAKDGLWDWNIKTDEFFISARGREMLGFEENEVVSRLAFWTDLIHPEDFEYYLKTIDGYITGKTKYFQDELRFRTKSGEYKWILIRGQAIWGADGKPTRMAGSYTDITERKKAEERINYLAYYDSLTGLPNRALFLEKLNMVLTQTRRNNQRGALLFLDLDNFKTINDTLGHIIGDRLLKDISDLLRKCLRESDIVARLGGDEFVVLQSQINSIEAAFRTASRIIQIFQKPFKINENVLHITTSIGITIFPDDGQDEQTLLRNADTAMYRAKELGRNNFQLYTEKMKITILEKLEMENDLRRAVKRGEFVVYYQPQIEIATGKICGVEALVRWRHPVKGLVLPLEFIPLAEESGLIIPIGEMVLRTAGAQIKAWQEAGLPRLRVAVNLSERQFRHTDPVESISKILQETCLESKWLELEITESVAVKDIDFTISILRKFNQMGIHVSLDNFGAGCSSLNELRRLPINTLKIDKSFVHDITLGSNEEIIAKATISLAHDLKLIVTAEGVETKEQYDFLKNQFCDRAQGYLFSKPLPAEEIEKLLKENYL